MKMTYLCALPLALILAAYSGQSVAGEPKRTTDPDPEKEVKCEGNPKAPMVEFDIDNMKAIPECVRAHKGMPIVIRLTTKKNIEDFAVTIEPEDFFDVWLQGKNDAFDDVITMRVPGKYDPELKGKHREFHYAVVVDDQKTDPRVRVDW